MRQTIIIYFCLYISGLAGGIDKALAEEYPKAGLLYSVKENGSLLYECRSSGEHKLNCNFTRVSVRKNAKPEDINNHLNDANEQFEIVTKSLNKTECDMYSNVLAVLKGNVTPPNNKPLQSMSMSERNSMAENANLMVKLCNNKSKANYIDIVKNAHEKAMNTCTISATHFSDEFSLVRDNASDKIAWVVNSKPEGNCGIVQLSRFESDRAYNVGDRLWSYHSRKAITNPNAKGIFGIDCSQLDQDEYIYSWQKTSRELNCKYLEYFVF